jgi:molybdopterin biosynthesis enzyme
MPVSDEQQHIARLTPLHEALAALDTLAHPVAPRAVDASAACGSVLAADVTAGPLPVRAMALRDGFAVRAADLDGAGSYAPVPLSSMPARVEAGDEIPQDTDTVVPPEALVIGSGAEAVAPVAPGEGVIRGGSESDPARPLRKAGERVRIADIAVFIAAGIGRVSVRQPRLQVVAAREDLRLAPALDFVTRDCAAQGCRAQARNGLDVDDVLATPEADAVVIVGGSGVGRRDRSVQALASRGQVALHGVGLMPGETAAIGCAGSRPVIIVPGQLDAAMAAWLTLGRRLLARLAGSIEPSQVSMRTLTRKVTSPVGFAEVVPARCIGGEAEPLARQHLPLWTLARANGWLLVPASSEGYAAGSTVAVNEWP